MTPKKGFVLHGNNARVNPESPNQINSPFLTNVITNYKTNPDGTVENILPESDPAFTREAVNENQK
ncbi:MAG: hypothetical protein FWG90_12240 [Oscillospiraceae bacterium]|nr:hypothetical protein [Oscillospiraceae bacterium]